MKVLVLGAAGKLGGRLVESCLAHGCETVAAARSPLPERANLQRATFAIEDTPALEAAMQGCDALISAAGNLYEGEAFAATFDRVVGAAERVMGCGRRVWMLAGAAVLDIPRTNRPAVGLPFVPAVYQIHLTNWRRLERSRLDWSLMCPGFMTAEPEEAPGPMRVSIDALPFDVGPWTRYAPPVALSLLMKSRLPRLAVPYRAVADAIVERLRPSGPFARTRVGVAPSERRA